MLFLHALRLCRSMRKHPAPGGLPQQSASLATTFGLPRRVAPDAAHRATVRASARAARWSGHRDTCLTRSLVVGALLSDQDDVLLHVGFASALEGGGPLDGHAWVSVGGVVVGGPEAGMAADRPSTGLTIPVRRLPRPDPPEPIGGTIVPQ